MLSAKKTTNQGWLHFWCRSRSCLRDWRSSQWRRPLWTSARTADHFPMNRTSCRRHRGSQMSSSPSLTATSSVHISPPTELPLKQTCCAVEW